MMNQRKYNAGVQVRTKAVTNLNQIEPFVKLFCCVYIGIAHADIVSSKTPDTSDILTPCRD